MPTPRKSQISLEDTPYYHCVSRCVRRAFLCGEDRVSGKSYEHRRQWVEDYLLKLASVFAIDICAYAVMSNHTHIVTHINQEVADAWSVDEVLDRWLSLHQATLLIQRYRDPIERDKLGKLQLESIFETVQIYRQRLYDLSWFMRHLNEHIARQANKEDNCTGRFWEGRFKSQALLDESALVACMAYVDLNPVRAKMASTPETSSHTSVKQRVKAVKNTEQPVSLFPFAGDPSADMGDIEALLVLDAIEQRGSYAAAAEQLNKVPSALSYIVQKLEEQFNVTIFIRQGRRSVLTPAGKYLLIEGRKVLSAINALSEQTQTIANGWEPKIRIACDSVIDIKPVFTAIECFLTEHNNIEIDVQEEVMNGTWEALFEDKVDLVIGAPEPVPYQKGIRAIKIKTFDSVLVVSSSHELSKASTSIQTIELSKYRSVVVHDSAKNEIPWSVNIIEGGQHFYVSSVAHKVEAIIAGIGIGYLPRYMAQEYIVSGQLREIELIDKKVPQNLFIAWKITNKGKGLNKLRAILLGEAAQY